MKNQFNEEQELAPVEQEGLQQRGVALVGKFSDQARQRILSGLSSQKDLAAERLDTLRQSVRRAADGMTEQAPQLAVDYMGRAADRLDKLTEYVSNTDVEDMMKGAETYVRRHPGVVLGGALMAGLLMARLLKSAKE